MEILSYGDSVRERTVIRQCPNARKDNTTVAEVLCIDSKNISKVVASRLFAQQSCQILDLELELSALPLSGSIPGQCINIPPLREIEKLIHFNIHIKEYTLIA